MFLSGVRLLMTLVEAAGIEPASENQSIQLSPSAAGLLGFPSRIAGRQAMRYGSHYAVTAGVAPRRSRSPLIDAPLPVAVARGRTGGYLSRQGNIRVVVYCFYCRF